MSSEAFVPPQEEPEHRTPDYMDNDHLLDNLKVLHQETKSDNEDEGDPFKLPSNVHIVTPKKETDPGRFMYIWLLGIRLPALVINGEPHMPVEVLKESLRRQNIDDARFFDELLRKKNIYVKVATDTQFKAINAKSDLSQQLKITSFNLMSRSDVDRIMGELREESRPTACETQDPWNDADRVHVVHVNFIDYNEEWLDDSDDLEEDPVEYGTHGWWYKNRINMRCIVCQHCEKKFTPTDFSLHHHFPLKNFGVVHCGLTSANWHKYITIHKSANSEENKAAWQKFVMNAHRIGKRAYDDAAPVQPFKMEVDKSSEVVIEGEEIAPKRKHWLDDDDVFETKKKNLHVADFLGPSGSKALEAQTPLENEILKCLNKLDEASLEKLFLKPPEEFYAWIREMEFHRKVVHQQKEWQKIIDAPGYKSTASAHFNPKSGEFENMHYFDSAARSTKQEILELAQKFTKINRSINPWDIVKQEHALFAHLSDDALRVLNNRPAEKPRFQLPATPMISLPNLALFAQQLLANGVKLPMISPMLPMPLAAPTPIKPIALPVEAITPALPQVPLTSNIELLKQQISLAMSNPSMFPILYPKLPADAYEHFSHLLKSASVKS